MVSGFNFNHWSIDPLSWATDIKHSPQNVLYWLSLKKILESLKVTAKQSLTYLINAVVEKKVWDEKGK